MNNINNIAEKVKVEKTENDLLLQNVSQFPSFGGAGVVEETEGVGTPFEPPRQPVADTPPEEGNCRNTINYMVLPYNPALKERARQLRKAGNLSEVLFWNQVKNKQFKNFDFDRQKIIGNYIVDFFCTNCNVAIEIDGSSHDNKQEYDAARDEYLETLGLEIIHIADIDVKKNISAVMTMLHNHPALTTTPSACDCHPSKGGEFEEINN